MAAAPSDFLVFVDESGDHGLQRIDPEYPVFVLVFCLIRKSDYARRLLPALTEFKFKRLGAQDFPLKSKRPRRLRRDLMPTGNPQSVGTI